MKITTAVLRQMKEDDQPIAMVTAYDYPSAKLAEEAGVDMIPVGDSLGMVVLGYDSTIPVTVEEILHHTKAVTRAVEKAMVVADLPFLSYRGSLDRTLDACSRLLKEGGAHAVKLEGGEEVVELVQHLTTAGVPVMGHLGLTPQSVYQLGGYKVQGQDEASAKEVIKAAQALEDAGAFGLVLECVPAPLAKQVTEMLNIPVIGIGAGVDCDGQVLVFHDLLGYASQIKPKFVKQYGRVGQEILSAIRQYVSEVKSRRFPGEEHSYKMDEKLLATLYGGKGNHE